MYGELFFLIIILLVFFVFLIKGADFLIACVSIIAKRLGISPFVIGISVVAIGTSLPELFTSIAGILSNSNPAPFIIGTIVGSNIANILLVFGILLLFGPSLKYRLKIIDQIFFLLATILLVGILFIGKISFITGIIFLILLSIYIYTIYTSGSKNISKEVDEVEQSSHLSPLSTPLLIIICIAGLIALNIGARGVVYGITELGILLLIPTEFLTLTTIAFATSLPEITVTLTAVKKNNSQMAIGNLLGSNISNVLLILGVSGTLTQFQFLSASYTIGAIFLILSTLLFLLIPYWKYKQKWVGFCMLLLYLSYIILIF